MTTNKLKAYKAIISQTLPHDAHVPVMWSSGECGTKRIDELADLPTHPNHGHIRHMERFSCGATYLGPDLDVEGRPVDATLGLGPKAVVSSTVSVPVSEFDFSKPLDRDSPNMLVPQNISKERFDYLVDLFVRDSSGNVQASANTVHELLCAILYYRSIYENQLRHPHDNEGAISSLDLVLQHTGVYDDLGMELKATRPLEFLQLFRELIQSSIRFSPAAEPADSEGKMLVDILKRYQEVRDAETKSDS